MCNDDYPASLELRKLYQVVEDDFAQQHALLRVIDESGEDYLYPDTYFVRVALPKPVEQTLHRIVAEIVREAVHAYVTREPQQAPPGAGAFASGRADTAERAEEVLAETGFGTAPLAARGAPKKKR